MIGLGIRNCIRANKGSAASDAEITFALEQTKAIIGAASGTTATITLDQAIPAAPRLLVFGIQYAATPTEIISADSGITLIDIPATRGGSPMSWGMHFAYALHNGAIPTQIVLTFAGNHGGVNIGFWEVSYSGGTPALDCANRSSILTGTSVDGPAFTLSGGNSAVFHLALSQNNVTAVAAPYNDNDIITSGCGFTVALNQATAPAPTWTIDSSGQSAFAACVFGLNPTAFKSLAFVDFEAGADGADCTAALLKSSTKGYGGGVWTIAGTGAAMKFETDASKPLVNATGRLCDGVSYPAGAGSRGVRFLTATSNSYLRWDTTPGIGSTSHVDSDVFSAGIWFRSSLPGTDSSNMDVFSINAPGGSGFANAKFLGSVSGLKRAFQLEVTGGGGNDEIEIEDNTWYWITLLYDRGTGVHIFRVYEPDGTTLRGEITEATTSTGYPSYITIGQSSSNTPTTGHSCDFDSGKFSVTGEWPLTP